MNRGEYRYCGIWNASVYRPELESLTWRYKQALPGPIWEPVEEGIEFHSGMVCAILNHDDHRTAWLPRIEKMEPIWSELYDFGMRLREYVVPVECLRIGITQVCYLPMDAKFSREIELEEFYKAVPVFDFEPHNRLVILQMME